MTNPTYAQRLDTERANTGVGSEYVPYQAACPCGCGADVTWTSVRIIHPDDAMLVRCVVQVQECPTQRVARAQPRPGVVAR